ncbi:MAG: hypothetical protein R3B70_13540 [Polyangiaceae bacterium]
MLAKVAALAWAVGLESSLGRAVRPLADRPGAALALGAVFDAAVAAEDSKVAQEMLNLGAGCWSREAIRERRKALERLRRAERRPDLGRARRLDPQARGPVANPAEVKHEIDTLLAPELPLGSIWEDEEQDADFDLDDGFDDDGFDDDGFDIDESLIRGGARRAGSDVFRDLPPAAAAVELLAKLGLTQSVIANLSPEQGRRLDQLIDRFGSGPPSLAALERFSREIQKILGAR